jgi:hypothetical protein
MITPRMTRVAYPMKRARSGKTELRPAMAT